MEGKTWIEFDDGDSGFFQLNEIKRIHPDFPVEGINTLPSPRGGGGGGRLPCKREGSDRRTFQGFKVRGLVPLSVFESKTTTFRVILIYFRQQEQLELVPLIGVKIPVSHTHKTWYLFQSYR